MDFAGLRQGTCDSETVQDAGSRAQKNKGAKKRPRIPENVYFQLVGYYFLAFLAGFFAAFFAVFFAAFFVAMISVTSSRQNRLTGPKGAC